MWRKGKGYNERSVKKKRDRREDDWKGIREVIWHDTENKINRIGCEEKKNID